MAWPVALVSNPGTISSSVTRPEHDRGTHRHGGEQGGAGDGHGEGDRMGADRPPQHPDATAEDRPPIEGRLGHVGRAELEGGPPGITLGSRAGRPSVGLHPRSRPLAADRPTLAPTPGGRVADVAEPSSTSVTDHDELLAALPPGAPRSSPQPSCGARRGHAARPRAELVAAYLGRLRVRRPAGRGRDRGRVLDPERPALDGGRPIGTVIQLACEDRDFTVTSLTEELHRAASARSGCWRCRSGDAGRRRRAASRRSGRPRRRARRGLPRDRARRPPRTRRADALLDRVRSVLEAVFTTTDDQAAMRDLMRLAADRTRRTASSRFDAEEVGGPAR